MDHYSGVVVPVGSDSLDKLDERAAGLWDSVLRPRCVVEVANQNVVPMLHREIHTRKKINIDYITQKVGMEEITHYRTVH